MISGIERVMDRISVATEHSPIAVFKTTDEFDNSALLSVFANTVETQKMIAAGKYDFVGEFDQGHRPKWVRNILVRAMK